MVYDRMNSSFFKTWDIFIKEGWSTSKKEFDTFVSQFK